MTMRRQGALALGVVLLAVLAGCNQPGAKNWRITGPPRDSRYLGVAILTTDSASVKSDRVATRNGARVDFYLLNLTSQEWRADVSFPKVPAGTVICRAGASEITNITLAAESDATAKCLLDREAVDRYCDSIGTPPAAAAPGTQGAPNVPAALEAKATPPSRSDTTTTATLHSVCEIEYAITFTSPDGKKKVVDPRLEIER